MKTRFANALVKGMLLLGTASGAALGQSTPIYSYAVPAGGYAPNNNLINYSDQITGSWNMQYDNLNRLQSATASSGYYNGLTLQWQYDSFGNRLSQAPSGTYSAPVPGEISATYDANNRISTSSSGMGISSYDAGGNVILDGKNQIWYDAENRVCAVLNLNGTLTQYLYNAEGQRVAKGHSASGNTLACPSYGDFVPDQKYILGQNGEQVSQLNTVNNIDQWDHSNVWVNGQLLATYDNHPATINGQLVSQPLHFNISDALGTKRVQTSATGVPELTFASLPYGDGLTIVTGAEPDATQHHFTGKERDAETGFANGNDYFGARHYGSSMGRFLSPDWNGEPEAVPYADLENPQSLNLYGYVQNNPLSSVDIDGHARCPDGNEADACVSTNFPDPTGLIFGLNAMWIANEVMHFAVNTIHSFQNLPHIMNTPGGPGCVGAMVSSGVMVGSGTAAGPGLVGVVGGPTVVLTEGSALIGGGAAGGATGAAAAMSLCPGGGGGGGAGSGSGGGRPTAGKTKVTFGHGARHLKGTGLNQSSVENAIKNQVEKVANSSSSTGNFWGKVQVNGQNIYYRAYTLQNGSINVGTYTVGAP